MSLSLCHYAEDKTRSELETALAASATLGGELNGESLTCDGCHPKDAGLTIMAETIAKAIRA